MKSYLPIVIILALIGLGAVLILANNNNASNKPAASTTVAPTQAATLTPTKKVTPTEAMGEEDATDEAEASSSAKSSTSTTITITDTSTTMPTVNAAAGKTITWVNNSKKPVDISSDPHPQHTLYPEINEVGTIQPGAKKTLTLEDAGTYKWHDHMKPTVKGTIVVK